jgi:hypothetical protein
MHFQTQIHVPFVLANNIIILKYIHTCTGRLFSVFLIVLLYICELVVDWETQNFRKPRTVIGPGPLSGAPVLLLLTVPASE